MADETEDKQGAGAASEAIAAATKAPSGFARRWLRIAPAFDRKVLGAAVAGLLLGTLLGFASAPRDRYRDELNALRSELAAGRADTARLFAELERGSSAATEAGKAVAAAETEAGRRDDALVERVERLHRDLAALHEDLRGRSDALGRDQAERIAELARTLDRKLQAAAQTQPKVEPATTGSIGDAAAAAPTMLGDWALREVLDGAATIQDRKRRVVEVARGDVVPGVGRVEAVERRGAVWTVVTKRGLIVPQDW